VSGDEVASTGITGLRCRHQPHDVGNTAVLCRSCIYNGWIRRHRRSDRETLTPAPWRANPLVSDGPWARVEVARRARTRSGGRRTGTGSTCSAASACACAVGGSGTTGSRSPDPRSWVSKLTQAAYAHGLALALPEKVELARPRSIVKHHLANVRSKTGAETTAQLAWILTARLPEAEGEDQEL
jgi:hypothetical protein